MEILWYLASRKQRGVDLLYSMKHPLHNGLRTLHVNREIGRHIYEEKR